MACRMGIELITRPSGREVCTLGARVASIEVRLVTLGEIGLVEVAGQAILGRAAIDGQVEGEVGKRAVLDAIVIAVVVVVRYAVAAEPRVRGEDGEVRPGVGLIGELGPVGLGAREVALFLEEALVDGYEVAVPGEEGSLKDFGGGGDQRD